MTDAAKKRLRDAGYDEFSLKLKRRAAGESPLPTVTGDALTQRLLKGETVVVVIGRDTVVDRAKYPAAVRVPDLDSQFDPGVYAAKRVDRFVLDPLPK